jgi:hypothetical protein
VISPFWVFTIEIDFRLYNVQMRWSEGEEWFNCYGNLAHTTSDFRDLDALEKLAGEETGKK